MDSEAQQYNNKFTETFDPIETGLHALLQASRPGSGVGDTLAMGLLAGRKARLDQAQARAMAAAAKRAEQIEMTGKGMYETDAGFGRRRTVQTPTGVVLVEDTAPTGETSYSQVYAPPEKTAEPKDSWTISSTPVTLPDGRQVLYKINKYTGEMQEVGAPAVKPGGPGGAGTKAERQAVQTAQGAVLELGGLRDIISSKERMDELSGPVGAASTRLGAAFGTGSQAVRDLNTLRSGVSDQVLSEVSKLAPATQTDVALILKMKAPGPTAGQGEWVDWYNRRAVALRATLEKNAPEMLQDPSLAPMLEPISLGQKQQANTTSTGATWRVK